MFHFRRKGAGQSAVEFALISFFLFVFLLGIFEVARLLFVFSVVSNAAQEGSRYGIIRPRDVLTRSQATQVALAGGTPYITEQIVDDGLCNAVDKAREKVWGVPPKDVSVRVWYDDGSGTPIVPTTRTAVPYRDDPIVTGNRVVVEASYKFNFIVPLINVFAPNGITVKMRSARTILNNGTSQGVPCTVNMTPAPVPTVAVPSVTPTDLPAPATFTPAPPSSTPTSTGTSTPAPSSTATSTRTATSTATPTLGTTTPTNTATVGTPVTLTPTRTATSTSVPTSTSTPTNTPTATATPTPRRLYITRAIAIRKNGNNKPLSIEVDVTDGTGPFSSATVTADVYVNGDPVPYVSGVLLLPWYAGTYQECPAGTYRNGDSIVVNVFVSAPGYISTSQSGIVPTTGNFTCR